jgi:hypothetical protein
MSLYCNVGSPETDLSPQQLRDLLLESLAKLGARKSVLVVPPDYSRVHSRAGDLTQHAWEHYGDRLLGVLPALGTHAAMTPDQIETMFGPVPTGLFRVHNWRTDVETLGEVPAEFIHQQSEGKVNYPWPAQVNRLIAQAPFDLILSIGQVVPHEVIGMANYNKNILVGTGGRDGINRSHYLGAVFGMERIMGRAENPVRNILNYAADHFLRHLPIIYVLTVIGRAADGRLAVRGLYIGDDAECFHGAAALSSIVNFERLDAPIQKAVYRTRMALANDAELIILAPGVKSFGEDRAIDLLIRKYGYRGTPATLAAVGANADLADDLSAAAHLIHGSSEERFTIRWCPGDLAKEDVEGVGYQYGNVKSMLELYNPKKLQDGYNCVAGEEIFYISNPGLGLWAYGRKLDDGAEE